jgi:deoxyhypusine synthase
LSPTNVIHGDTWSYIEKMPDTPFVAQQAVFVKSQPMEKDSPIVKGVDFNRPFDLSSILSNYGTMGFQATAMKQAIDEINRMVILNN